MLYSRDSGGGHIFYIEDSTRSLWPCLGVIDDATIYHVVIRIEELTSAHVWRMFSLTWMSWSGPPRKIVLDQLARHTSPFDPGSKALSIEEEVIGSR